MNGELCHSNLLFPMPSPQHQDCLENHFPSYSSCANSNTEAITGSRTGLALRRSPFPREQRWPDQRHPEKLHSQARLHLTQVFVKTLSIVHQSKINQRQRFNTMAAWSSTISWGWISWSKTVMEKWGWKDVHRCLWKAKAYSRESRRLPMCRAVCRHSEGRRSCSSLTSDQSSGSTQTGAER